MEAAFITEHGQDGQSNGHLLPLFYRSVSFYCRGEITAQIKANFTDFRPCKSRTRLIRARFAAPVVLQSLKVYDLFSRASFPDLESRSS